MQAHNVIGAIAQQPPVGFRAPGYDLSERVLDVLMAQGYRYDSSVFPSWPYYVAKAGVMAMMALVGRRSRSVLGDPRVLFAPPRALSPGPVAFFARPVDDRRAARGDDAGAAHAGDRQLGAVRVAADGADGGARAPARVDARGATFSTSSCTGSISSAPKRTASPPSSWPSSPTCACSLVHKQRALEATLDRLALDYRFCPLRDVAAEVQREGAVA